MVASSSAVAWHRRRVGHCCCILRVRIAVDTLGLRPGRCNCSCLTVGVAGPGVADPAVAGRPGADTVLVVVVVRIDFVVAGSGRVELGGRGFADLRRRFQRRLSFGVQLVCWERKAINAYHIRFQGASLPPKLTRNIRRGGLVGLGDGRLLVGNRWHQPCM